MLGLFDDRTCPAVFVELHDPVAVRIPDAGGENGRPAFLLQGFFKDSAEPGPVEEVVAEGVVDIAADKIDERQGVTVELKKRGLAR